MPAAKTTAKVPWTISTDRADATATLSYTDPLTRKAVKYKFSTAAQALAWAYANVLILPPGAKVVANSNPALPGGASYDLVLPDGTAHTFASATELGNFLVSKVGYATTGGRIAYENKQKGQPPLGDTVIKSPYELGHPAQTGLEAPATGAPKPAASGSRSGGVTLEPTPQDSGIVPTDPYALPPELGLGGGGGGSGGGGGYGAPNTPGPALSPDASPAEVEAYIRANYGYEAWMLDVPELRDLLTRSVKEGPWDDAKFQGELGKTTWWRQNGAVVFNYYRDLGADPATMARRTQARADEIGDLARSAGLDAATFSSERIKKVATDALKFGWTDDQIRTVIANEFNYQPGSGGDMVALSTQVKALAKDYLLPMTDAQALNFAKSMYVGELTQQGLAATFAQQAAARFPALADSISQGVTPGQYFSTYQTQIAGLLEKPAEAIDFLGDPRMQKVVDFVDEKGNRRPMTLSEVDNYVRTLPEWDTTKNARDSAFAFTQYLGQKFGRVAS